MPDVSMDNVRTLAVFISDLCLEFDVCSRCPVASTCVSETDCERALLWYAMGNPTSKKDRRYRGDDPRNRKRDV